MRTQNIQLRVSLTGSYATALYKEAEALKCIDTVLNDINIFKELLASNTDLEKILKNKLFHVQNVLSIITEISELMNFSILFVNFLKILITNRRGAFIKNIFANFQALIDFQENVVPVRVEIAKINKKHNIAIEELLKKVYPSKKYRFEYCQNSELLSGFRAFIYERCLDYSLKSRLNRLSYQLKEA